MKPADETLAEDDEILEDYSLVPIPSCHHLQHVPYFSTVAVGSDIYLIGGPYKGPLSSRVRIFDCRSHTWRDGPNMLVAREAAHGATEFRGNWFLANVFRGKIYVIAEEENFAYDPKEGTWEVVGTHKCYGHIDVWWYDTKSREWREVKGSDMEVLHKSEDGLAGRCLVQIVNHGGKLLVIWVPGLRNTRQSGKGEFGVRESHLRSALKVRFVLAAEIFDETNINSTEKCSYELLDIYE
ncbi:F-box/kelch-repeat protein At5g39560-like [Brassica rapa]|uniref:F-box/kelch-repeat protein At5g39560-like n=1 Tax=Brassica campestris TaxID=3711 RepID=UPI0004F1A1DE|nr:F-box/kelch-repeat protein At5g39560-like [Brassica rapa]